MFKKTALAVGLAACTMANAEVLTTIKPLGFIANAITDGVTETKVLLPTSASPHDYSLKPSDIEQLQSADLVVWVGEEMESFLEKSLEKVAKDKVLTLADVEKIDDIVAQTAKAAEKDHDKHEHKHDHKHDHAHHHDHDEDWHIWLSPAAAELTAEQIAEKLAQKFPAQQDKIRQNLAEFKTALATKNSEIEKQLLPLKSKGYYTFHEAYGYFEQQYGLKPLGSFTINPAIAPGAKTLKSIKQKVEKNQAQCLFTEPQFTPKVVESLSKNSQAHIGTLDPLGSQIALSKTAYTEFLQSLADQFSQCLSK